MPPRWAQAPKATTSCAFWRSMCTHSSCSDIRTPPLMKATAMDLSGIASMSRRLKSMATGQSTMSTASTTLRICSSRSTTASSHPPQEAHQ